MLAMLLLWSLPVFAYQPQYSTAGFYSLAGTGREAYSMNPAWRFIKTDVPGAESPAFDDRKWQVVFLPHGLEYLPVEASGGINYQGPAWYRKHFTPDDALKGKQLFLYFEAVMGKCKVWVNGVQVTEHFGGFLPFSAEISNYLHWGADNVIAVRADNSDDPSYPPGKPQSGLDWCYFGGIYRNCWLVAHNDVFITDPNHENEVAGGGIFVSFENVGERQATVKLKTHVRNAGRQDFTGSVEYELTQADGKQVQAASQKTRVPSGAAAYATSSMEVASPKLWSPDAPYLYHLNVRVKDATGTVVDGYMIRVGIRSVEFKQAQGLWLNGKPYKAKLIGANRHQDFAMLGFALPNSLHWRDAKKLRDAGFKVIRAHYPQAPAFMDACDELGLFVEIETPGWQFWSKEPIFGQRVIADIRNMVREMRNRPSLFFWEPILNETSYPEEFAKQAAETVHEEYPFAYCASGCDQTAKGARYFEIWLHPPNGNPDPTKTYFQREWGDRVDNWSAQNSVARCDRAWGEVPMLVQVDHYNGVMQGVYSSPSCNVGGCLWYPFEYARGYAPDLYYGAVMDYFRQPKTSYWLFQAQRDPVKTDAPFETGPMIHIAHDLTPFSPEDVTVFCNCDEVRLTFLKGGKPYIYKKDPAKPGMPSPVIRFPGVYDWNQVYSRVRSKKVEEVYLLAEGLINGKVVVTDKRVPAMRVAKLELSLDNNGLDLVADGSDMITLAARLVDAAGTTKTLNNKTVKFSLEGEGRIVGDADIEANPKPLVQGTAPVLIQSTTRPGQIKIHARLLFNGPWTPAGGELVFNSVKNETPAIRNPKELLVMEEQRKSIDLEEKNGVGNKAGDVNASHKADETLLKEVEAQQTKFGRGINDGK